MLPTAIAFAVLAAMAPSAAALSASEKLDREVAMAKVREMNRVITLVDTNVPSVYAPYKVDCPANMTWVRPAKGISDGEQKYLERRASSVESAVKTLTQEAGLEAPKRNPVIGMSMSGGGYRAMINTMGQAQGLMKGANGTGGWMDAVSYMVGLSGGSWATGTFAANGGQKPTDLNDNVWDMDVNLISPGANKDQFFSDIAAQVKAKYDLGFPVQITDIWGLAIANHILPREYRVDTNPNMTISNLPSLVGAYENASIPMPIIVAAGINNPKVKPVPNDAPIYEYTPYEFGTWDSSNVTEGGFFTPVQWLGSDPDNGTCYHGYDQLSFITGVSATLFNQLPFDASTLFPNASFPFLDKNTSSVATVPNPFEGYNGTENPDPTDTNLTLVDAGETNQNVPLLPLLTPERKVDAILAFDASGDTDLTWPNGDALYTTYTQLRNNTDFLMPAVPSPNGFINGGYNTRPTFFGCNDDEAKKPLIVYIPNYPYSAMTNISTFTFQQAKNLTGLQLESTMKTVTLDGASAAWPTCLACALTDRANGYTSANRSELCTKCFSAFCWNGDDNTTTPATYAPAIGVPEFIKNLNLTLPKNASTTDKGNSASALSAGKALVALAAGVAAWAAV